MQLLTVVTVLSLPLAWACTCHHGNFTIGQTIETSSGHVSGHAASNFPEVSEYLGIPYAQPPIGNLRFAAPVKYTGSSMINGSAFGPSCPQLPSQPSSITPAQLAASNITEVGLGLIGLISHPPNVVYSEDCLYINIWTKPQSGEEHKAVMVFIYGGGFDGGTSALPIHNGATLADQKDVIVVNFNYRLSILGFPGNPTIPNNVAFLDQRLALEWVRDNIAKFGGDPSRITLFGQSAGSASTDYYSYAWKSDPIISGIILESGTTFSFGLPYPEVASAANWYNVSGTLGCGGASTDSATLLACMRNVDVNTLMGAVPNSGLSALLSAFGPTADEVIVFSNYSEQTPGNLPVLLGNNDYEAGIFRTELALANVAFPDPLWDQYNLADYTCPAGQRANASVAAHNPTWRYRYFAVYPNIDISSEGGAYHGAELPLIFGTTSTFSTVNATAEEIDFEDYIQGAWTTFAKDPVRGLLSYDGGWPLYNPAEETLIRLGYDNLAGINLTFPILYDAPCADVSIVALECAVLGVC